MGSARPADGKRRFANLFLDSLECADAALVAPLMRTVTCSSGTLLSLDGRRGSLVYFPATMVACLRLKAHPVAVGLVGREGIIGWASLLRQTAGEEEAAVLLDGGTAYVASVAGLRRACRASSTLTLRLLEFLQAYNNQLSGSVRVSARATLRQKLSAWLLMLHDRIDEDFFPITHAMLAAQLAVRRATVTEGLQVLEGEQALRCERGMIFIRDRAQLERAAGSAYRAMVPARGAASTDGLASSDRLSYALSSRTSLSETKARIPI